MIALPRDYACRWGAPVIRAVDERIFSLRYFARCMACGFCHDQCCDYGVDIDSENMERLRELGPAFETFAGVPHTEWFTRTLTEDGEFPSGWHARTAAKHGKCIFADRAGRGCRIHAFCIGNGLDYHLYKPMVSILFPVTFEHGTLVPSPEAVDASLVCGGQGERLYDGVREEIGWYFGEELLAALDVVRGSLQQEFRQAVGAPDHSL